MRKDMLKRFNLSFLGDTAPMWLYVSWKSCLVWIFPLHSFRCLPLLTPHLICKPISSSSSSSVPLIGHSCDNTLTRRLMKTYISRLTSLFFSQCYIKHPIWWDYNYRYLIWWRIISALLCCLTPSSLLLRWQWPALAEIRWESWSRRWHRRKAERVVKSQERDKWRREKHKIE